MKTDHRSAVTNFLSFFFTSVVFVTRYDICSTGTINEYCTKYGTEVFAHPLNCAQFVNCAQPQPRVLECGYPKLFAGDKCYHHSQVTCGERFEPVAPCELPSCLVKLVRKCTSGCLAHVWILHTFV